MESAQEQLNNSKVPKQLKKYVFKKGISGNPGGRPVGAKSMKEYSREYLESLNEDERIDFMNSLDPDFIWKMAEGNPRQDADITTKGLPIIQLANEVATKNATNPSPEPNSP